jgi:hypothetical protein
MFTPRSWTLALGLALTLASGALAGPPEPAVDSEATLEALLEVDSDGDGIPDLIEVQEQTDPLDAEDTPGVQTSGVPVASCPGGMRTIAGLFCIHTNPIFPAKSFQDAAMLCKILKGRLATALDLYAIYVHTDLEVFYNPQGRWIGPELVGDDQALCGNRQVTSGTDPDRVNFEGTCNKADLREYWCALDLQ